MVHVLGIDIGGTGVKAAPVDTTTGELIAERQKIETPQPSTPEAVADVVQQLVTAFQLDRLGRHHLPRSGGGWRHPHGGQPGSRLDRR